MKIFTTYTSLKCMCLFYQNHNRHIHESMEESMENNVIYTQWNTLILFVNYLLIKYFSEQVNN